MALAADVNRAGQTQSGIGLLVGALGFPIDHLFGHVEALLQLATGNAIAMRRHVTDFGGVDAGEFHGIDTERVSAQVDGLFDRPFRRRIAEAAKRAGGNFVGIDQFGVDPNVGIFIAGVVTHGGDAGDRRRFGRVSAVVGDDFYILGANAAVFLETHLDVDFHEDARPAAGEKFLFAGVDQLDRLARFLRQHGGDQGIVVVAGFAAEAAADCALNDPHLGLGHAQRGGDAVARVEQRLSVHVDGVFAAGGVFGNTADGLDRAVPLGHARKRVFDDDIGFGEGLGDVAALQVEMHGDVVRLVVVH